MVLADHPLFILFTETVVAIVIITKFVSSMQLTVVAFAKKMKVHRGTVYRWITSGIMPAPWKAKVFLTRLYVTDED